MIEKGGRFPELETERLVLRRMTIMDAKAIFDHFSDDEVTRHMDISSLADVDEARGVIRFCEGIFERGEGIRWGIESKEDGALIGTCGFNSWVKERGSRGEIGYDLSRSHWGRGLIPEALEATIRYGFEKMNLNRIEALVVPEAERSMRVLRKLGFQREGVLREYGYWKGRFWDEVCFSLLKKDLEMKESSV